MSLSLPRAPIAVFAAVTALTTAVVVMEADPGSSVEAGSPGTWLSSASIDAVTKIGPGGSEATIELGDVEGGLQVIEVDGVAYAIDDGGTMSRIDPASFEVSVGSSLPGAELVGGGDRLYSLDRQRGTATEIDPDTLQPLSDPVEIGERVGSAVVDDDGVLWITDEANGAVVRFGGELVLSSTEAFEPGSAARLAIVDGQVVLVDASTRRITLLGADGAVSTSHDVAELSGSAPVVPRSGVTGDVLPVVDEGRLIAIDIRSGEVRAIDLEAPGHEIGEPVVANGIAVVSDLTDRRLILVDLATGELRGNAELEGVGERFDVVAKGDYVYVNDPSNERAWVIGPDGEVERIEKYDPSNPNGGGGEPDVPPGDRDPAAMPTTPQQSLDQLTAPPDIAPIEISDPASPAPATTLPIRGSNPNPATPMPPVAATPPNTGSPIAAPAVVCDEFVPVSCPAPGDGAVSVRGASAGDGEATVEWRAPDDWYDIVGYSVTVVPDGNPNGAIGPIVVGTVERFTQTGLVNGRTYYFVIEAIAAGNLRGSAVASARVQPRSTSSGLPTGVRATVSPCTAIEVAWSRPDDDFDLGNYQVELRPSRGGTPITVSAGAGATSLVVDAAQLTVGTGYVASVRSISTSGAATEWVAAANPATLFCSPDQVAGVRAAAAGDATITVEWDTPPSNGRSIDRYEIEYVPAGGSAATASVAGGGGSTTIDALTNGVVYTVRVRAQNAAGWGPWSSTVEVTPLAAVPEAPRSVSVDATDGGGVLTWAPPVRFGWSIDRYRIDIADQRDPSTFIATSTAAASARSTTLDGLDNGTTYVATIRVIAIIDGTPVDGTPATSNPFRPVGLPGAPVGVTAASTGDGQATVRWAAPTDDGGEPITGFRLTYGGVTIDVGPGATERVVDGLTNGADYTFVVAAVNSVGAGDGGSAGAVRVQSHTPSAPGAVTATAGNQQVDLAWSEPAGNGTAVVGYDVQNVNTGQTIATQSLGHTDVGLTNGTAYQYRVRARGANGSLGPWANAAPSPVVPAGAPGAPGAPSAVGGDRSVTLSWSPASANGGSISHYNVRGAGVTADAASSPYTVTGLTNGSSYTFEVRAVGTNGLSGPWVTLPSATPTGPPEGPTGLQVSVLDQHNVTVTFSQVSPTNGTTVSQWEVSTVPATSTLIFTSRVATLAVEHNTNYTVMIVAIGANGQRSAPSEATFATPNGPVPSAIPDVYAMPGLEGCEPGYISWSAAPGATGYQVTFDGDTYTTTQREILPVGRPGPGTYPFQIVPQNMYGSGPASTGALVVRSRAPGELCP